MGKHGHTSLGSSLRAARKSRGLTLEILGERIGVTPGALSHIESGRRLPDPKNAIRIAEELELSSDDVLQMLDAEHAQRRRSQAYPDRPASRTREREMPDLISSHTSTGAPESATFHALPIDALFSEAVRSTPPPSSTRDTRSRARWSQDAQDRMDAMEELADQAGEAIRTLRGMLGDDDAAVRDAARRLLRELDIPADEGQARI